MSGMENITICQVNVEVGESVSDVNLILNEYSNNFKFKSMWMRMSQELS